MDKAKIDEYLGEPGAWKVLDQVGGYAETFDSTSGPNQVNVTVWTHGSPTTAHRYVQRFAKIGSASTATALAGVPDGIEVVAQKPASDGAYHDDAAAPYGRYSIDIELKTATPGQVLLLTTLAQDQFRRLSQTTPRS